MTALDPSLSRQLVQVVNDASPSEPIRWGDVVRMVWDLGVPVTRQWLGCCHLVSGAYHRHREARASPTGG